jgi:endonuclease-3
VDPVKVEFALMDLLPQQEWTAFSHRLILHGRAVCHARNPRCESCALARLCPKVGVKRPAPKAGKPSKIPRSPQTRKQQQRDPR